jgi:hypothetical protein
MMTPFALAGVMGSTKLLMAEDKNNIYGNVLEYFSNEFNSIEEKLKSGQLEEFRERVLVSQKITDAIALLAPYARSDAQARLLVRNAEALRKDLLSVRDVIIRQISFQKKQQAILLDLITNGRDKLPIE